MGLPMLRRCCGCLSLEIGCFLLCILSTLGCIGYIIAGSWNLPRHRQRELEDNLISMTAVMFSALSAVSNAVALAGVTALACIGYIIAGSWNLPRHRQRELEDNLISMTAVMFSALSAVSNAVALAGVTARRPGCLQLALVFNSVFILCIFLVAIVTCLFSPELAPFMKEPGNVALVVLLLIGGAVFSMYYLMVINSLYRKMKMSYSETLPM